MNKRAKKGEKRRKKELRIRGEEDRRNKGKNIFFGEERRVRRVAFGKKGPHLGIFEEGS